ncbi:MAG: hypothetical protein LQ343_001153 [Gyalolechia ehrenbergii]|nr:MAG: hypothetical protein LQ343_001153 [Gyalolechia ehrenbergii]
MGNSSTKEQRTEGRRPRHLDSRALSSSGNSGPNSPANAPPAEGSSQIYSSRIGRGSRPDLSALLGLGSHSSEHTQTLESRRETKQEREARKLENERVARLKERERSMREEHVDGGYLVTQGVYTGIEDFDKRIVRQLMIERRLAPFWRGLTDYSDSWTENQLIAAARGLPIPAADEIPKDEETGPIADTDVAHGPRPPMNDNSLTVPITSRSPSYASDSSNTFPSLSQQPPPPPDVYQPNANSGLFRGRAKTLASLTTSSKHSSEAITPAEIQLPRDPYINGQRIEVFLYKDTFECPICLIYYPSFGNRTRCCDQWICSECFVQIKRPDPHPPEHVDPPAPPPSPVEPGEEREEGELVSEPATCPFCKQTEFGITYEPPPFRRGLAYVNQSSGQTWRKGTSAMSSSTSLSSGISGGQLSPTYPSRRRTASVSANDISVVTTDRVRPDWHHKLMSARAHASRRSAAATALHTAAYLIGDRGYGDGRGFSSFGRRGLLRRSSGPEFPSGGNSSAHASMMTLLAERHAAGTLNRIDGHEWSPTGPGPSIAPPRGSSRRNHVEDIEEMMMMEAIRLSLASEEERHKQQEKIAKKEAKKAEKEAKKKEKAARKAEKAGLYSNSANQSTAGFSSRSEASLTAPEASSSASGKGKATQRTGTGGTFNHEPYPWTTGAPPQPETDIGPPNHPFVYDPPVDAQSHLERARAQLKPELLPSSLPFGSNAYRPSHLRTTSNVSSSASSVNESPPGSSRNPFQGSSSSLEPSPSTSGVNVGQASSSSEGVMSGTPPGGGAGLEPMFNFRSLAEMIGKDEGAIDHGPFSTAEEDQALPQRRHEPDGSMAAGTERSDSMATVQPSDEFHEVSEYRNSRSSRDSLNQPAS